jgi:hypothetical protein
MYHKGNRLKAAPPRDEVLFVHPERQIAGVDERTNLHPEPPCPLGIHHAYKGSHIIDGKGISGVFEKIVQRVFLRNGHAFFSIGAVCHPVKQDILKLIQKRGHSLLGASVVSATTGKI